LPTLKPSFQFQGESRPKSENIAFHLVFHQNKIKSRPGGWAILLDMIEGAGEKSLFGSALGLSVDGLELIGPSQRGRQHKSGKDVQERPRPAAKPPGGGAAMVQQDPGERWPGAIHSIRSLGSAGETHHFPSGFGSRASEKAGSKNEEGHATDR